MNNLVKINHRKKTLNQLFLDTQKYSIQLNGAKKTMPLTKHFKRNNHNQFFKQLSKRIKIYLKILINYQMKVK